MDYNVLVAANIRRQRNKCGKTQEQVAHEAGISPQHLSKIERGACSPMVSTLVKIAECLDVEPAYFFNTADMDTLLYMYTELKDVSRDKKPASGKLSG